MGLLDFTIFIPGGAAYKAIKSGSIALRTGASVAAASALQAGIQESVLYGTQQTRTGNEVALNIGAATLLGGTLDAAGETDRGPLANVAAAMVDQGRTSEAIALLDGNAASRRVELLHAAKIAPADLFVMPMAGTCLAPRLSDGDIFAIDAFGFVEPGQIVMFKSKSEPFHLAKVFVGLTTSEAVKTVFHLDFAGAIAIFWMANPDTHIFYALDDLEYLARIDGRVDGGRYSEIGSWPLDGDRVFDHMGDHIQREPLACFGCPPLAMTA